jgi:hypothetical protein
VTVAIGDSDRTYFYDGVDYTSRQVKQYPQGRITEFTNLDGFCDSILLVPGITIWSLTTL